MITAAMYQILIVLLAVEDSYCIGRQHLNYWDSVVFSHWRLVQPAFSSLSAFSCKLKWPGSILLICPLVMCHASMKGFERHFNFHHCDCGYTLIYAHVTSDILVTWHDPRLTNTFYAWSWSLCGITPSHIHGPLVCDFLFVKVLTTLRFLSMLLVPYSLHGC
jgi:hypothetical protein